MLGYYQLHIFILLGPTNDYGLSLQTNARNTATRTFNIRFSLRESPKIDKIQQYYKSNIYLYDDTYTKILVLHLEVCLQNILKIISKIYSKYSSKYTKIYPVITQLLPVTP